MTPFLSGASAIPPSKHNFPGRVHCCYDGLLFAARGRHLFTSRDSGLTWECVLELPLGVKNGLQSMVPLFRRLLRQDVYHLVPVDQRIVVVFAFHAIFVCDYFSGTVLSGPTPIHGSRPLSVCLSPDGALYYGEYSGNKSRHPVHVFRSKDQGRSWSVVYRLEGVRHIHGIYHDRFEDAFWVTTGDTDTESAIWISKDRFQSLRKVLAGSQQARAIRLLFTPEHVYFGTDAPEAENHIYQLCRKTFCTKPVAHVGGPVFHGSITSSGLFFSTACEPSTVNREREAVVWHSTDGNSWRPFLKFHKDALPMKLFQYGQVFFAEGQENSLGVWLTPFATRSSQQSLYYDEHSLLIAGQG
jgi:hypothetical protein